MRWAMADSDDREYIRRETIKELIGLAGFIVTALAYQATIDPTFREVWKARIKKALGITAKRDLEKEALEQVQKEISLMEHGEFGEATSAD